MLNSQKHLFGLEEGIHYLNCAYKSPLMKACEQAATEALQRELNPYFRTPDDFFSEAEEIKTLFSQIINCRPAQVAITPSASYGLANAINNVACRAGQHAITIENEFPSDYFALKRWCDTRNAELKMIKADPEKSLQAADWNERIISAISESTAMVNISSIHWMNGLKFDLEKIGQRCREVGAKFIVDGTQSVGAMPMDVQRYKIDALVCASYKWLFGPYSLGVAYMGEAFNNGIPIEETWMNRTNAKDFSNLTTYEPEYKPDAGRYNVGEISNFILLPILKTSLQQIKEWTVEGIQAYCEKLVEPLQNYLKELGVEQEDKAYAASHLFGLKLPPEIDMERLKTQLLENRIYVSVRGSSLRVSVNVFNTEQDIAKLIAVIETVRENALIKP